MVKIFNSYSRFELDLAGIRFGDNVSISNDVTFHNPKNIIIGNNVRIDAQCLLIAGKDTKIIIGNNVHISAGCYYYGSSGDITLEDYTCTSSRVCIYTGTDDYTEGHMTNPTVDPKFTNVRKGNVILRKHVVVGSGSTILPGVTLEFATSVGAHSLVSKSTSPFDVVFGVPAKFYKKRKDIYLN